MVFLVRGIPPHHRAHSTVPGALEDALDRLFRHLNVVVREGERPGRHPMRAERFFPPPRSASLQKKTEWLLTHWGQNAFVVDCLGDWIMLSAAHYDVTIERIVLEP